MAERSRVIRFLLVASLLAAAAPVLGQSAERKFSVSLLPPAVFGQDTEKGRLAGRTAGVLEKEFVKGKNACVLRMGLEESLREFEQQMAGLVKDGGNPALKDVDYFIISVVSSAEGRVLCDLRAVDAQTLEIAACAGFTVKDRRFERSLAEAVAVVKAGLTVPGTAERLERMTVFSVREDGDRGLAGSAAAMLPGAFKNAGGLAVIEREKAGWAVGEKQAVMAGLVNRDPLKKASDFHDIQFSVEGTVITGNPGVISLTMKLIDVRTATMLFMLYDECYSLDGLRGAVARLASRVSKKYLARSGKLTVESVPPDALVYIRKSYMGRTPILVTDLEAGDYPLVLKKTGYLDCAATASIQPRKAGLMKLDLKPVVWDLYHKGLKSEAAKEWGKAVECFTAFIEGNPESDAALDAKFRIAHVYQYGVKDFENAIRHYDELIRRYAGLEIVSESMYGMGYCLSRLQKTSESRAVLEKLVKEYPETSAAEAAVELLKTSR